MFYGFLGQRRGDVIRSGFSQATPLNVSLDNGLTFIETLSNPFQGGILAPVGAANGIATSLGATVTYFDPNPKSPRMQRWQVGIQRDLGRKWMAEVRYVGNYGSQIQTSRNLNALPNQYLSTSPTRDQATIDYLGAAGAESVRRADAVDRRRDVARDDHRAGTAAPALSPVRRGEQHHQRRGVLVPRAAAAARSPVLERLHRRRPTTPTRASRRPSSS